MRKVSAFILLMVFLTLQFGKVATYLYCKWQAEIVNNAEDCGCDTHLAEAFQHTDGNTNMSVQVTSLLDKLSDFSPENFYSANFSLTDLKSRFPYFKANLSSAPLAAPFHPPAC